ncbi:MAG: DVU_1553 family AMP-dependent CoA ligase [Oscillospiraceae bacterium]
MLTGISPIEEYVGEMLHLSGYLTPETLFEAQLTLFRETLRYAKKRSVFYSRIFADFDPDSIKSLSDIEMLPMMSQEDIRRYGEDMLCMPQSGIEKIVTMQTSGSEGAPKRLCFTGDDIASTEAFFGRGMFQVAQKGDRVVVFLPGDTEMSVGTLIEKALKKTGLRPSIFGPISDMAEAVDALRGVRAGCLIGLPSQILQLARTDPALRPECVMLCADYVPDSAVAALMDIWGCEVFCHYGSTEMCLGGGVECREHDGYHMRDADMLFEIVDPNTGLNVPDGEYGEVVFTTLRRRGMPLIRYRTGDISKMLTKPCKCGGLLRRLSAVRGRISSVIKLFGGIQLSIHELDEVMFAMQDVLDYTATVKNDALGQILVLEVKFRDQPAPERAMLAIEARFPGLRASVTEGTGFYTTGVLKRTIFVEH